MFLQVFLKRLWVITNIIMKRQEAEILSLWDEQLKSISTTSTSSLTTKDFTEIQKESLVVDPTKKFLLK